MLALRHLTLRERIYEDIVELITTGELRAGDQIDEKAMTERLSISRTPFREAIGALAKEGLVEIRPYRGFLVRQLSLAEATDLYELRKVLEGFAVRLAVARLTERDAAALEASLDAAITCLAAADMPGYAKHDRDFHERIAGLSGNHALIDALARLALQIQLCRVIANRDADFTERAARERDEIMLALRRRDADRAAALMGAHIADVQAAVLAQLAGAAEATTAPLAEPSSVRSRKHASRKVS